MKLMKKFQNYDGCGAIQKSGHIWCQSVIIMKKTGPFCGYYEKRRANQ